MNFTSLFLVLIGTHVCGISCKQIMSEPDSYTDEFAVAVDGTEADAKIVAEGSGFIFVRKIVSNYYLFRKPAISKKSIDPDMNGVKTLKHKTKVLDVVQQVRRKRVLKRTSDPEWDNMWFMNEKVTPSTKVQQAWRKGYEGEGIKIAVLDDGIYEEHPDLRANMLTDISYDFVDGDDFVSPHIAPNGSHGTLCTGLIVAEKNNDYCIVGVAPKSMVAGIRILSEEDEEGITDATEASALTHELDQIDIYSNSWGPSDGGFFSGPDDLTQLALSTGITKGRNGLGAIYVWAAGNGYVEDNCNADGYVNSIYTIAITSIASDGLPAIYNEYCAPAMAAVYGGDESQKIISTDFGGTCTGGWVGTSFSTPQAAGIIALTLQANPLLTWRDVQHLIVRTAQVPSAKRGWNTNGAGRRVSDRLGFGLMNADAMVTKALTWKTVPEQKSCTQRTQFPDLYIRAQFSKSIEYRVRCTQVHYLEHVLLKVDYSTFSRGHSSLTLISPSGTESKLLTERELEEYLETRYKWTYMSVQFWGEQPNGTWTLRVSQGGAYADRSLYDFTGLLSEWQLIFYGTETDPDNGNSNNNNNNDRSTTGATTQYSNTRIPETEPVSPVLDKHNLTTTTNSTEDTLNIVIAVAVSSVGLVIFIIAIVIRRTCLKCRRDILQQPCSGVREGMATTNPGMMPIGQRQNVQHGRNADPNQLFYIVVSGDSDKRHSAEIRALN